jgi:chitodextrinase
METSVRSAEGLFRRACNAAALLLLVGMSVHSARAQDTVFYAQAQPYALKPSASELHVELATNANVTVVSNALREAGFDSLESLGTASSVLNLYRLSTNRTTAADKAVLRAIPGIASVRPAYTVDAFDRPVLLTDEVVVRCKAGTAGELARDYALTLGRRFEWLDWLGEGEVHLMHIVDETDTDAARTSAALHNDERIIYSHPNFMGLHRLHQTAPINDPFFAAQWHLDNSGASGGVFDADIDAPEAWEISQGEGVLVAVFDSAFDLDHEDLINNYSGIGFNAFLGTSTPASGCPHGTAVSGLICAEGNGIGVRGVAPKAKFMAISFEGLVIIDGFHLNRPTVVADAYQFAKTNGADIVNNSWGSPVVTDIEVDSIRDAAITGRNGRGLLILFSSGNDGGFIEANAGQPQIPEVMAVGATLRNDTLSCYSNFGLKQSIVAPGGGASSIPDCFKADMVTTDITGDAGYNSGGRPAFFGDPFPVFPPDPNELENRNYTNSFSGTSAACPVATGVAALALSVNPDMTRTQLRNLIEHTADKVKVFNSGFDPVTGHDIRYGHGRVNAFEAVKAARDNKLWPSPITTFDAFVANNQVSLVWKNPTGNLQISALLVRGDQRITWRPEDEVNYEIGDQVAPGVVVLEKGSIQGFIDTVPFTGVAEYAVFIQNAQNRYSWGRLRRLDASLPPGQNVNVPVSAIPDITVGSAPLTVEFAAGVPSNITPTSYRWDFDDGSGPVFGRFVSHTYAAAGVYEARLTVAATSDITGETVTGTAVAIITVNPTNLPPTANIQAMPNTGFAPLDVTFTGGGDDPDGNIIRFIWDFGDNSPTAQGAFVTHTYEFPGNYNVHLTVLDDDGATSEATINILASSTATGGGIPAPVTTSSSQTPSFLPGFCGAMGVETLAMAGFGLLLTGFFIRRRTG